MTRDNPATEQFGHSTIDPNREAKNSSRAAANLRAHFVPQASQV